MRRLLASPIRARSRAHAARVGSPLRAARLWLGLGLGLGLGSARARADETYEVRGRTDPPAGAAATSIDVDAHAGEATSVADLLDGTPGVQVREAGGLGAFSAATIRGGTPAETIVTLDGIPLNRASASLVDLGDFDLESLERIDVYRGLPPPDRFGAGLGGVIDLIPKRRATTEAGARIGSFGTRGAFARAGRVAGPAFLLGSASWLGSAGDFTFLDTRGTDSNTADDRFVARANDGFEQLDALASADVRAGTLALRLADSFWLKTQGVPGRATAQARHTSLTTLREIVDARAGAGAFEARAHATFLREHYKDPLNEVGNAAQDDLGTTWAGGGELRGAWTRGPIALSLVPQALHERYALDRSFGQPDLARARTLAGGAAWLTLALGRLTVEPALRVDGVFDDGGSRSALSPRAGARARASRDVTLHASAGRYFRLPSLGELYGDRGAIVGNPSLRDESGTAGDLGATFERDAVRLDATLLASRSSDLIVLVATTPGTVTSENIGHAQTLGAEIGAEAAWRRLRARVAYTFLDAENRGSVPSEKGRSLPGVARHQARARVDAGPVRLGPLRASLYWDADVQSGVALDRPNWSAQPLRQLHAAGLKIAAGRDAPLLVVVEVRNLLDTRVETVSRSPTSTARAPLQDYAELPLPGRAVFASARMTF